MPSGFHSSSPIQSSSFAPVSAPIVEVSHSQSEPTPGENPALLSTCTPHILPSTFQAKAPATTNVHTQVLPQTKSTPGPNVIDLVWAGALKIAREKLSDTELPLDLTNFASQSMGENIRAVINALDILQKDEKKKRWRYTWHGKEVIIVERLAKILKTVEQYSKVVDTAIQSSPQLSALVWAGVWAIMRVGIYILSPTKTILIL